MKRPWMVALVCGVWSLVCAEQATVYRWVNDQGVAQFTQTPPVDRAFERIDDRAAAVNTLPPAPSRPEHRRRAPARRAPQGSGRSSRERVRQRCETARQRVRAINDRMRAGYRPAQGERLRERLRGYERERYRWCIRRGR